MAIIWRRSRIRKKQNKNTSQNNQSSPSPVGPPVWSCRLAGSNPTEPQSGGLRARLRIGDVGAPTTTYLKSKETNVGNTKVLLELLGSACHMVSISLVGTGFAPLSAATRGWVNKLHLCVQEPQMYQKNLTRQKRPLEVRDVHKPFFCSLESLARCYLKFFQSANSTNVLLIQLPINPNCFQPAANKHYVK